MKTMMACATFAAMSLLAPEVARAQSLADAQANTFNPPVSGTFDGGTFQGQFRLEGFGFRAGAIVGVGTLSGVLIDPGGVVLAFVQQQVEVPLTAAAGTCTLISLQLGPVDIALLGLNVHLGPFSIQIAVDRASLLGMLLCSVLR